MWDSCLELWNSDQHKRVLSMEARSPMAAVVRLTVMEKAAHGERNPWLKLAGMGETQCAIAYRSF
jgi:hypothetical protein